MAEDVTSSGYEWTLASFTDTIHRGGVALWAWSPTRRLAQLDGLCREFWGTSESVVPIDDLFARVNAEDRRAMPARLGGERGRFPSLQFRLSHRRRP